MNRAIFGFIGASLMLASTGAVAEEAQGGLSHYVSPEIAEQGFPFSTAVKHGDTLYLAGVIGTKAGKAEVVDGGIVPETERAMEMIGETLAAHNLRYSDLVKCTVFLADMAEWPKFNEIYRGYFGAGPFPARSAFGVPALALNARLEIECIAAIPE